MPFVLQAKQTHMCNTSLLQEKDTGTHFWYETCSWSILLLFIPFSHNISMSWVTTLLVPNHWATKEYEVHINSTKGPFCFRVSYTFT